MNTRGISSNYPARPHHRLDAWKRGMSLVKHVYRWSAGFPVEKKYGLVAQMRRAAVSVPSNIAEGAAREGSKEFAHFLSIARGSLSELDTQYLLAINLGLAAPDTVLAEHISRTSRLVAGLHRHLLRETK